jgi:hypothetical protein
MFAFVMQAVLQFQMTILILDLPILFAPCHRISRTAWDRFFDPAVLVASLWEIQCRRKRGI